MLTPSEGHKEALFAKLEQLQTQSPGSLAKHGGFLPKGLLMFSSALLLATSWFFMHPSQDQAIQNIPDTHTTQSAGVQATQNQTIASTSDLTLNNPSGNGNSASTIKESGQSQEPKSVERSPIQNTYKSTTNAVTNQVSSHHNTANHLSPQPLSIHSHEPNTAMQNMRAQASYSHELAYPQVHNLGLILYAVPEPVINIETENVLTLSKPKHRKALRFEIDLLSGMGLWNRSGVNNLEHMPGIMGHAQIRGRIALNSRLSFMTGLGWHNHRTQVDYAHKQEYNTQIIDTVHGFIVDPSGNQTPITRYDTSNMSQIRDWSHTGTNQYVRLDIPVSLYYAINKDRHRMYAHAGILFSLHTLSTGVYLPEESYSVVPYTHSSSTSISNRSLGFNSGLGYAYALTRNWSLFGELQYTSSQIMGYHEGYKSQIRIQSWGIGLGIQYGF